MSKKAASLVLMSTIACICDYSKCESCDQYKSVYIFLSLVDESEIT